MREEMCKRFLTVPEKVLRVVNRRTIFCIGCNAVTLFWNLQKRSFGAESVAFSNPVIHYGPRDYKLTSPSW